jgi:hypothetical protein
MKINDVKIPLALWAGSWIITRSVRWGAPYLMQGNLTPNSLAERIKRVYTNITTSNDGYTALFGDFLGIIYDWTPTTIAFMSYLGSPVQICKPLPFSDYVKFPLLVIGIFHLSWIVIIYLPTRHLSLHGPKPIAQLAIAIKPWVTPTAMFDENDPRNSLMYLMYRYFFDNGRIDFP